MTRSQYTGLILVSGKDTPGITSALFETLSAFSITILDVEQVVARDRVILTVLIALNPAHADAIEEDLNLCGEKLGVDVAVSFQEQESETIAVKTGLMHVVAIGNPLSAASIASLASTIAEHKGNIERIHRTASYPITAVELIVSGTEENCIRPALASKAKEHSIDVAVSPGGLMRFARKFVLMDVDSTLIQQEVIELLGARAGAEEKIRDITNRAMAGELDFAASLTERVALLAGLPASVLDDVRAEIVLTPGARTLVTTLHKLGHSVGVVSGGFTSVIEPIVQGLGIKHYRANTLEVIDNKLTGKLLGPIIDRAAKATALREFAASENIDIKQTIAIGDGANDLDMIAAAGLGIAFNAKPAVAAAADSSITAPYLDSILYLLGITREDLDEAGAARK